MAQIAYSKSIPVKYEADVCVVGAGPAGVAAAVTCARAGRKVFLAEAHTCAGGMGTAGLVPVFMTFTDGINFLSGGIGREVHDRLRALSAPHDFGVAIDAENLKRLYEDMLSEAGAEFSYHTPLIDVEMSGGRIRHAIFSAQGGVFGVGAEVFIDATGNGEMASLAGAKFKKGDENGDMMPATLCSLWTGIDWDAFEKGGARSHDDGKMPELLRKAMADGVISQADFHHTGLSRNGALTAGGNLSHCFGVDPDDPGSVTAAYVKGRRLLAEYQAFYRRYVPGCGNASIAASGSLLGVREGRRIIGDYVLNFDDYKARRIFPDEIGRYNFGVDIHPSKLGIEATEAHKKEIRSFSCGRGESYGVPYRILLPLGVDGLLVAGRCASTDRKVFASLRVMPGCYITGMAAGMAAALSVESKSLPRSVDIKTLQRRLKEAGAFLPNA